MILDLVQNFRTKNLGYRPKNMARSSPQISKYLAKCNKSENQFFLYGNVNLTQDIKVIDYSNDINFENSISEINNKINQ